MNTPKDYGRDAKFFSKDPIEWTATRPAGIRLNYKFYQRNDINWNKLRSFGDKRFIGNTNFEAAAKGMPPELPDDNFTTLHHRGQKSPGPLVEGSTRYHGVGKPGQDILHSQYGRSKPHPTLQPDRKKFDVDTREYWKWRVNNRG
ncbi:HNH/ENDO VII family nuclease [Pseudomonas alliivorans]|nr:HNH/ENDO VII family nuclease [Pseudomonas alliivorans]MEE4693546.1 HNH/ENDO VII family nuclease [Pseudomonas alliivorans]MEE4714335.1 HNH/ENDO VII family nuclease [Pseudomonas alliivorans]MEE4729508.1 HNH/ENDO VII family nuclease [Pseudomonas alliivorans]MEE4770599.1 HNH/ENDO VII family nuclease [Pseudomonas alliivorans]